MLQNVTQTIGECLSKSVLYFYDFNFLTTKELRLRWLMHITLTIRKTQLSNLPATVRDFIEIHIDLLRGLYHIIKEFNHYLHN